MRVDHVPPEDDGRSRAIITHNHELTLHMSAMANAVEGVNDSAELSVFATGGPWEQATLDGQLGQPQETNYPQPSTAFVNHGLISPVDFKSPAPDAVAPKRQRTSLGTRKLAPKREGMDVPELEKSSLVHRGPKRPHQIKDRDKTADMRKRKGCIPCRARRVSVGFFIYQYFFPFLVWPQLLTWVRDSVMRAWVMAVAASHAKRRPKRQEVVKASSSAATVIAKL
jgi:hypothetical protein